MKLTIVKDASEMPTDMQARRSHAYWTNFDGKRCLYLACKGCGAGGFTSKHEHTENPDGTITLNPSVMCPADCGAHYWIKNSEIVG